MNKQYSEEEYGAMLSGIKSVLNKMKEGGYIDRNIEFHEKAIEDLARRFYRTACNAYESGFKSGILQTLRAIREEKIAIRQTEAGITISSKLKIFPTVKPFAGVVLDLDSKKPARFLRFPRIRMSEVLDAEQMDATDSD